jgi:AcrR family transcriptional regulator
VTTHEASSPLPGGAIPPSEPPLGLRERKKRERTERILAAALELLREDPDSQPTVERIAARAHVAPMTVFNLVGNWDQIWSALADLALEDLDITTAQSEDPQERARQIVDAVVRTLVADPVVFRALLSRWSGAGSVLKHDPTDALVACLEEAAQTGILAAGVSPRRYGEVMAAGLLGTIQLWTAGILSNRALRTRAQELVDIVFAAARSGA